MSKRTLDSFFTKPTSPNKKAKTSSEASANQSNTVADLAPSTSHCHHPTYPWPIPHLPDSLESEVSLLVTSQGRSINDQPHLNLLYYQPFIPQPSATQLFHFLRTSLPFYRVRYTISRFGKETIINTPRYTTVFGLDATSVFLPANSPTSASDPPPRIVDAVNKQPVHAKKYHATPRPIPQPLALLQQVTEAATNTSYNFCLVNYYADGADSISYHSDDERFLGHDPAIASFSLGARRDFLMKHKPPSNSATNGSSTAADPKAKTDTKDPKAYPGTTPLKFPLGSGDMILMQGETQANWLHSIPKRTTNVKDKREERGRINITFRKAMVPGGTENYYRYNVGEGGVWRWDESLREMREWRGSC